MNHALLSALAVLTAAPALEAQDSLQAALNRATLDYGQRLEAATAELNHTRSRVSDEKAPLIHSARTWEDRIIALEAEILRLERLQAQAADSRHQLQSTAQAYQKHLAYLASLADDALKSLPSVMAPGENEAFGDALSALPTRFDAGNSAAHGEAALDTFEFLLDRIEALSGGHVATGRSLVAGDNRVVTGTFALVGPETYFRSDAGDVLGTVRSRPEGDLPVTYAIQNWSTEGAHALFGGLAGTYPADASGGKALRMRAARGTWLEHLRKGGMVGVIILGLGLVGVLISLMKLFDLRQHAFDRPEALRRALQALESPASEDTEPALAALKPANRELFRTAQRHWGKSKSVLEEHLHGFILRQRLLYERRLPLLAVIVTAAPLLGLLGTVTGMVKTFTLITVFGTGSAEKLSSGISEALVTTELGLMVAIPMLVVHGFLSNRARRSVSLLERYAQELVTTAEDMRSPGQPSVV
jgi:biopolymer transport protein ExbB